MAAFSFNSVMPLVVVVTGAYLAWFGVHYWESDTKWPTDPIKAVLKGDSIPTPTGQTTAAGIAAGIENDQTSSSLTFGPSSKQTAGSYDLASLQTLWQSNGGHPSTAYIAAQVAMAESTGNPVVTSANPDGGTNVGLWQLDTKGVGSGYTVEQLQDPNTNARITVMATVNGTKWTEWADPVVVGGIYVGPQGPLWETRYQEPS